MRPLWERTLPGFLFLLLLLLLYADPLFLRRNFGARDLLGYHLPIEKAVHDAYARGRWPVWLAGVSGGRPLLANANVGALYPVRPLLSLIPFPLAMRIYPVLHWALAGVGVMLLLSATGASRSAAWVAAVTYVFSGVGVSENFYTNLHPGVALLPWIVWSVARSGPAVPRRTLLTSFLLGLDLLAGDVFTTALALTAAVLWIVLEQERSERARRFAVLAISGGFAALMALPQLVATLLWIPETHRAVTGMKLGEALRFSVSPWRLLEFFIPYPFGPTWAAEPQTTWARPAFGGFAFGFFTTLYAGSFAACAALAGWRERASGSRFARVFAVLGLAACVLPSLAPDAWSNWSTPVPVRYPEKMAVALAFCAAIFAGIAFDRFRRPRRWPLAVGALLALLAAAGALFPRSLARLALALIGGAPSFAPAAAAHLPAALAEGGLLWMAAVVALDLLRRPGSRARAAALLLVTLAPIAANRRIAPSFREQELFDPPAFVRALDRRDPSGSYRTLGESRYLPPSRFQRAHTSSDVALLDFLRRGWLFYTPILWNRGLVFNDDFDEADLSRTESLRRLSLRAGGFEHPDGFFGSVALKFGIRFPDQPPAPGFRRFGGTGLEAWDENPQALADLRLLERWREEPAVIAALNDVSRLSPGELVLETGRVGVGSARPGRLRILQKSPESLRVETETPDASFLFVLRGFWRYRSVLVDGLPAAVFPAQLAFSAVALPAGRHSVDWREEMPGGAFSWWGPVIYGICGFVLLWSNRRPSAPPMRRSD